MSARVLTHDDAGDFESAFYGFVFGDRPEWWSRPKCVWLFEPLGPGPETAFFAYDLDEAVEDLWALHYDIASEAVAPPAPRKVTRTGIVEPHAMPKAAWKAWRNERERLSLPFQTRAFRQQLFAHLPREHQDGTFGFTELSATVRTLDRYEACRIAASTVQEAQDDIEACWIGLREACVRVFGRIVEGGGQLAVGLVGGPQGFGGNQYLEVPEKVIRSAVAGTVVEAEVSAAYALAAGHAPFRGAPPRFDPAFPRHRWRVIDEEDQQELLHAPVDDFSRTLEPLNAWYRDYLEARRVHESRTKGRQSLLVNVADKHCDEATNLAEALTAFEPDHPHYLSVTLEEVMTASNAVPGTYFGLLDVARKLRQRNGHA